MYNPDPNPISELLAGAVESLDIPEDLFRAAATEYHDVGDWLAGNADGEAGWEVYPQGSFRLGTVVQPLGRDEYDIDLVCLRSLDKAQVTQAELKAGVGDELSRYLASRRGESGAPDSMKEGGRCFTFAYEHAFHLDVLPAIPDTEGSASGILLTDRELLRWQFSDPKAYAEWFKAQMATEFLRKRAVLAEAERVEPEEIPDARVKTTLQRTVQALKHHRNVYFGDELDDRPASILVTTLAARAYGGEQDLYGALLATAAGMPQHIAREGGRWIVANPVQPRENFADKWAEHPERAERFGAWLRRLRADLIAAEEESGVHRVAARLSESFGQGPIERGAERYAERMLETRREGGLGFDRATGALAGLTAGTAATRVKPHRFYGKAR
jgi:hypothetical protein